MRGPLLESIKDQVLNDRYPDLDILLRFEAASITTQLELWPEVCRRAQLECARETLKEAAEKAKVEVNLTIKKNGKIIETLKPIISDSASMESGAKVTINKPSITNANIKLIQ